MTFHYSLRIRIKDERQKGQINEILGKTSNLQGVEGFWGLEVIETEEDPPFFFIDDFLSLLEEKYKELENVGVVRGDISFWELYEYDSQCNMEFSAEEADKMGVNGITLHLSCRDCFVYDE